jgi:hypothetical protein
MAPRIRNPRHLELPAQGAAILGRMFPDYQEIVIKDELTAYGLSGGRVYQVHLIRGEAAIELPRAVKIASPSLIRREARAFQEFVRNQWPGIAALDGEPVLLPEHNTAALCYRMVGGGIFETQSLREYCLEASIEDVLFVLEARLFRIMEQVMLRSARIEFERPLSASYDRVLPVNLLIEPVAGPAEGISEQPVLITPDTVPAAGLQPGDLVRIEGFVVTDANPTRPSVTLNLPPDRAPNAYRMRLQPIEELAAFPVDQAIPPTLGVVRETRKTRLAAEVAKVMGPDLDPVAGEITLPDGTELPNPLPAVPTILAESRHVRVNFVHGDLNLENILVDPLVRDASLIDFADSRRDHVLLDFFRLETEVLIKLLPVTLAEEKLPADLIRPFLERLHMVTAQPGQTAPAPLHPALERPFAIARAIREAAREGLYDRRDPREYYEGLLLYLLGALKFENLDTVPQAPLPKQVAFLGAATLQRLLLSLRPARRPRSAAVPAPEPIERAQAAPVETGRPPAPPAWLLRRGARIGILLAVLVIAAAVLWYAFGRLRPQPESISRLCAVEESITIAITSEGESRYDDLLPYFRDANAELFSYLDRVAQEYLDGQPHRGATYILGAAGVGKSFVARAVEQFPEYDQCTIAFGEFAEESHEGIDLKLQPDLQTLSGDYVINTLPTFAQPESFSLETLLAAGGCLRDSEPLPLVVLDDINELHDDSNLLILKEVEAYLAAPSETPPFVHFLVFGRSAAFNTWLRDPDRVPPAGLWMPRPLEGPLYSTVGDLGFAVDSYYDFMDKAVPPQVRDRFISLVQEHPFLTYSIRPLATRNMIVEAIAANVQSEERLKAIVYDNLMERNNEVHDRPSARTPSYQYLMEEIALRYKDRVDDEGFFVVDFQDRVPYYDSALENVIGEVYVEDVLDRSGIAVLDPADTLLTRYRFEPFWIHMHLVEMRNQRNISGHKYQTCTGPN